MVVESASEAPRRRGEAKEIARLAVQTERKRGDKLERVMHKTPYLLLEGSDLGSPADKGMGLEPQNYDHFRKLHASVDAGKKDLMKAYKRTGDKSYKEAADGLEDFGKDTYNMLAIRSRGRDTMSAAMAEVLERQDLVENEPLPERDNGSRRSLGDRIRRRNPSADKEKD